MNQDEIRDDIKKFNELRDNVNSLWDELENDENIITGDNKENFLEALNDATNIVKGISPYYERLEKEQLYYMDCDFKNPKDKNAKLIKKLKKEDLNELAKENRRLIKQHKLRSLFLEVTLRCNAKCEHCGSSCGYEIPKDEVSAEDLKKTLLEIDQKYGAKNVFLIVTGGEPLMRKDLFDIMEYACSLGYRWGMTTNGILLNESIIKKMEDTNFGSISISLDGLKETHESFRRVPGSFEAIIKNIKLLQKMKGLQHLQITTVANKKNLHELEDMYKLLLDLGIKEWRVMCVDPIGRAYSNDGILLDKDGLVEMYKFIKEKRMEGKMLVEDDCSHYLGLKYENVLRNHGFICGAGIFVGSILSNGDICVCPNVRKKELVQGNIKTDSFVDVWENKFKIFRSKRLTTNDKCKKCKSYKYCRGGSFHTWDYDKNVPNMCMKEILGDDFIE